MGEGSARAPVGILSGHGKIQRGHHRGMATDSVYAQGRPNREGIRMAFQAFKHPRDALGRNMKPYADRTYDHTKEKKHTGPNLMKEIEDCVQYWEAHHGGTRT